MKKSVFLLFCILFLNAPLRGQEYIRRDYYGQGESRDTALQALMKSIGEAVQFHPVRLLDSYRADIAEAAVEHGSNGRTVLQLKGSALDAIFQARQTRTALILDEGRKTADPPLRMTYFRWAWYYLSSLPPGHQLPGKEEVEAWIKSHAEVDAAPLPVPMTHIQKQIQELQAILGDIPLEKNVIATSPKTGKTQASLPPALPERPFTPSISAASPMPGNTLPPVTPSFRVSRPPHTEPTPAPEPIPLKTSIYLTAGMSPDPVFGMTVNLRKHWGALLGFQSNFRPGASSYTAFSDGTLAQEDGYIWPNGNNRSRYLRITAGASCSLLPWLDLFGTAGYGHRRVYWQDTKDAWALIKDLSAEGPALTAGALLTYRRFSFLLEINTISFQTLGLSIGTGVCF